MSTAFGFVDFFFMKGTGPQRAEPEIVRVF